MFFLIIKDVLEITFGWFFTGTNHDEIIPGYLRGSRLVHLKAPDSVPSKTKLL
jgi:hypothetical protein